MISESGSGRVWIITGGSSGFGSSLSKAAIDRGDSVVVTARDASRLDDLVRSAPDRVMAAELNLSGTEGVPALISETVERFGRVDVLVNNAGHGQVGAVEETTDDELRRIFDVHVFGPFALTRAVLPVMRSQGSGAIVQMSSMGGQIVYPGFGAYCATKFALEGFSEALSAEVAPFGIKVVIVEPGSFRTGFAGSSAVESDEMPEYSETSGSTRQFLSSMDGTQPGDPALAAEAIISALEDEHTPLRLALGSDSFDGISEKLEQLRTEMSDWESISRSTDYK